jgi:hypothetical protein
VSKKPSLFSRVRTRLTRAGRKVKFASVELGADLSGLVPAPKSLLERLGIKKAFVPAGKRATVRTTIVTPAMLRKAKLEAEEGRTLSRPEIKEVHGARKFVGNYLEQKLRFNPSIYEHGPKFVTWDRSKTFEENWHAEHRRFLQLAQDRTGMRYILDGVGEWRKVPMPGASRKIMSDADWRFYNQHYYANQEFYEGMGPEIFELPPGEVSPKVGRKRRSGGRANRTGRSATNGLVFRLAFLFSSRRSVAGGFGRMRHWPLLYG